LLPPSSCPNCFGPPEDTNGCPDHHCYETTVLRFYRNAFEKKASEIDAEITTAGSNLFTQRRGDMPNRLHSDKLCLFDKGNTARAPKRLLSRGKQACFSKRRGDREIQSSEEDVTGFLKQYRKDISALPVPTAAGAGTYLNSLPAGARRVAVTLLPLAAALKHRRPELGVSELFEEVKRFGDRI
jgi:hypothetical protein